MIPHSIQLPTHYLHNAYVCVCNIHPLGFILLCKIYYGAYYLSSYILVTSPSKLDVAMRFGAPTLIQRMSSLCPWLYRENIYSGTYIIVPIIENKELVAAIYTYRGITPVWDGFENVLDMSCWNILKSIINYIIEIINTFIYTYWK